MCWNNNNNNCNNNNNNKDKDKKQQKQRVWRWKNCGREEDAPVILAAESQTKEFLVVGPTVEQTFHFVQKVLAKSI